jgi:hypothetical protein
VALLAFLLLMLSALGYVRRNFYQARAARTRIAHRALRWAARVLSLTPAFEQAFIRAHVGFSLVAFVALAFHFDYGKLDAAAPFLLLLAVDYAIRGWLQLTSRAAVASATKAGDDFLLLEIDAPAVQARHTEPGQYCYLRLPQLAQLQWHPMTIVSAPGAAKVRRAMPATPIAFITRRVSWHPTTFGTEVPLAPSGFDLCVSPHTPLPLH